MQIDSARTLQFGLVHQRVRFMKQRFKAIAGVFGPCDADACGDWRESKGVRHSCCKLVLGGASPTSIELWQEDPEFIARRTRAMISAPQRSCERSRDGAECLIAHIMTAVIVQQLKSVEVDKSDRQWMSITCRSQDFAMAYFMEGASIEKSR